MALALMDRIQTQARESAIRHHEIEVVKAAAFSVATVYDPPWFLAATDVRELENVARSC